MTPSPIGPVVLQAEVAGAVAGERVGLDERALVEEALDPLAGGALARRRAASRAPSPSRRAAPPRCGGAARRACPRWCGRRRRAAGRSRSAQRSRCGGYRGPGALWQGGAGDQPVRRPRPAAAARGRAAAGAGPGRLAGRGADREPVDERRRRRARPGGRAGRAGRRRRAADRRPRAAGPHLGVAAAGRADLQRAAAAGPARRRSGRGCRCWTGLAVADRAARARRGRRGAEVAERRAGRRAEGLRRAGRGAGAGRGRARHRPQRDHPGRRAAARRRHLAARWPAPRTTDRDTLLRAVLRALGDVLADPVAARGRYRAPLRHASGGRCASSCPAGASVEGTAEARRRRRPAGGGRDRLRRRRRRPPAAGSADRDRLGVEPGDRRRPRPSSRRPRARSRPAARRPSPVHSPRSGAPVGRGGEALRRRRVSPCRSCHDTVASKTVAVPPKLRSASTAALLQVDPDRSERLGGRCAPHGLTGVGGPPQRLDRLALDEQPHAGQRRVGRGHRVDQLLQRHRLEGRAAAVRRAPARTGRPPRCRRRGVTPRTVVPSAHSDV